MSNPARVLYVASSLAGGGAERQLVNLLVNLDRRQVQPELALYHHGDHPLRRELERAGVPLHDLGEGLHGGKDPRVLWRLSRLLRSHGFDLVHTTLSGPGQLARLASAGLHVPIITSERDLFMGDSRARYWLEKRLAGRARAMIANSQRTADHVARLIPSWRGRIRVVRNGVACSSPDELLLSSAQALRSQYLGSGERLLGVLGRLDLNKGPDLLADALRQLGPNQQNRLRLLWVGRNAAPGMLEHLTKLNQDIDLKGRVHWLPATAEPGSIVHALDALLLPSRRESMPNAVLEAMAAAKPVIASDTGDVAMAVRPGETGWLVPPGDSTALAQAVGELLDTPDPHLHTMGQQGQARVREHFSIARMVSGTMQLYREVLST